MPEPVDFGGEKHSDIHERSRERVEVEKDVLHSGCDGGMLQGVVFERLLKALRDSTLKLASLGHEAEHNRSGGEEQRPEGRQ